MNRKTRLATALVAGGVLAAGAVAVGVPAIAGAGPFGNPYVSASGNGPGPGAGPGAGPGMVGRGMGQGLRDGTCLAPLTNVSSGSLSQEQKTTLVAMAQEEKLAGDLYQALADKYPSVIFDRIAAAEDQHLTAFTTWATR